MSKFASLGIDVKQLSIREFEFNGVKFKLKVPLAHEAEKMFEMAENPPEQLVKEKYEEATKELIANKATLEGLDDKIKYLDNDILVGEQSMQALAKSQASGQIRILESFKLLINQEGKTLDDLTYDDIQADFPLPVQMSFVKKIAEVISPSYEEIKKN